MSAVQLNPRSVFAISAGKELTKQQVAVLRYMGWYCIAPEATRGIGHIMREVQFDSRVQATTQINDLALHGWLLVHEGCFKPSPKTINWLRAQGARAGLSAVTQEQNHVV